MDPHKDPHEGADPEDLPSDFFDDFNKDEFMQGLSVIDSWDDDDTGKRRIDAEAVENVKDLRELIHTSKDDRHKEDDRYRKRDMSDKYKGREEPRRSGSRSKLDDYIRPGSRRDPNKTNEAIKRDKEVKVKELIAKHLDDDLRPPGTELDEYYSEGKVTERKKTPDEAKEPPLKRRSRDYQRPNRESPVRHRRSPRRSPRREFVRRSPYRNFRQYSPQKKIRRYSPQRRSPRRISPMRRSPRRQSPSRRSPRYSRRSRSPLHSYSTYSSGRRSQSPRTYRRDTFLYPNEQSDYTADSPYSKGPFPGPNNYPEGPPGYSYPEGLYAGGYGPPGYEYGVQPPITSIPMPQPVPAPAPTVETPPVMPLISVQVGVPPIIPAMVPPPSQTLSPIPSVATTTMPSSQPFDALAQLVADGKLSQQDYLKLAPNKGVSNSMDNKTRVMVLNRCNTALTKLTKLLLPNRLTMLNSIVGQEPKCLAPKFCSPLKRQASIEFQFTKTAGATVQQNKQLVDSIIATIGLDKIVSRPKKKIAKDMKDAAVQTTKPYCDVCEIREATKTCSTGTSIDPEHFCASAHTQVAEQDLINSKSIFNPTGSALDATPMSIAHMTPAQLVSQLAARAKTLKQTPDSVPPHHPPPNNQWRNPSNYDNRGHYGNYGNYRY